MVISDAQYNLNDEGENTSINVTIDGKVVSVPLDPTNRHYAEILKQVADGDITIADAD
jgi:hypothetical protein